MTHWTSSLIFSDIVGELLSIAFDNQIETVIHTLIRDKHPGEYILPSFGAVWTEFSTVYCPPIATPPSAISHHHCPHVVEKDISSTSQCGEFRRLIVVLFSIILELDSPCELGIISGRLLSHIRKFIQESDRDLLVCQPIRIMGDGLPPHFSNWWILTCFVYLLSVFLRLVCLFCIINFTLPGSCDLRRPTIVVVLFVALYITRICRYSRVPPLACVSMFFWVILLHCITMLPFYFIVLRAESAFHSGYMCLSSEQNLFHRSANPDSLFQRAISIYRTVFCAL